MRSNFGQKKASGPFGLTGFRLSGQLAIYKVKILYTLCLVKSHITNGILEGINSKIQLAKRRASGYRNINNFINMIYFLCGKLKFDTHCISHRA